MKRIKSKCNRRGSCAVLKGEMQQKLGKFSFSLLHSFMTPLHVAAERAHNDVMEVLHKHGAKVRHTPEIKSQTWN